MCPTLADNSDKARIDERIQHLAERLAREHDRLPPGLVHRMVRAARTRFTQARIVNYVPVFVERTVRAHLDLTTGADERSFKPGTGNAARAYSLSEWARLAAHRLLAVPLPRRWAHTQGVARRADEVGYLFPSDEREVLLAAAWLHDIGYAPALTCTGFHPLDGARFLVRSGVPDRICALVARHTGAAAVAELCGLSGELVTFPDERGAVRDGLWFCDMTTGPDGGPVSYAERLAEIRARRGPDDPVVRALAVNGAERAAAVCRTEQLLQRNESRAGNRVRFSGSCSGIAYDT
ncbi:three-helix bundle dimerization domain-containing protein [Amycolatopsis alba]|uniref:three-helix bundle dimerization domain-containing protein n=1 Tax=Amycolatopsis alba TaxID=76020 RepID=UPI001FD75A57|nr:HD domain-containing protein [Amycolatopsis alba]